MSTNDKCYYCDPDKSKYFSNPICLGDGVKVSDAIIKPCAVCKEKFMAEAQSEKKSRRRRDRDEE